MRGGRGGRLGRARATSSRGKVGGDEARRRDADAGGERRDDGGNSGTGERGRETAGCGEEGASEGVRRRSRERWEVVVEAGAVDATTTRQRRAATARTADLSKRRRGWRTTREDSMGRWDCVKGNRRGGESNCPRARRRFSVRRCAPEGRTQAPLIFNGAFLARWECVLRQCIGARVEMRNLRKVVLFKGDPTHEFRAYSASAEFYIVCLDVDRGGRRARARARRASSAARLIDTRIRRRRARQTRIRDGSRCGRTRRQADIYAVPRPVETSGAWFAARARRSSSRTRIRSGAWTNTTIASWKRSVRIYAASHRSTSRAEE